MRQVFPCALLSILVVGSLPARAGEPEQGDSPLIAAVRKSVAWLVVYKEERQFRATGFVVARPGDTKKVILTAGHVFQNGMTLTARFPGMSRPVPCDLIAVSPQNDLMAVSPRIPIEVPALPLLTEGDVQPRLNDPVVVIGCPGGLDWAHYRGEINAESISAAELSSRLAPPNFNGKKTPFGDTLLLRHSAFSTPGMSGGPVLDGRGRVIGVQLGTLPQASNASLCVHAKHIRALDLRALPRRFEGGPVLDSDIGHALSVAKNGDQSLVIRIGNEDVDVRCIHQGYVPRDAKTVINRYIQDREWFRQLFGEERLQRLLDETQVAHITNPAFGFSLLVPKGYAYRVEKTEHPVGIVASFTSVDPTVAPPYNAITVRAFLNTEYYPWAGRVVDKQVQSGRLTFPKTLGDGPLARTYWRKVCIEGAELGLVSGRFPLETLGIRVRGQDGKVVGIPKHETGQIFRRRTAYSTDLWRASWERNNYDAETGTTGHAVHIGVWENVIVVVHYQFQQMDRENFFEKKDASKNFLERMFITSTVSLY